MLVSPRLLFLLGLVAWGTFFFELSFDVHFAVAELCGLEPFSPAAFENQHGVDIVAFFGVAAGFGVFGILADRFGRFRLLLWCLALAPVVSALGALSLTIVDFTLLRFLTGLLLGGLLLSSIVLFVEIRDPAFPHNYFAPAVVFVLLFGSIVPLAVPLPSIPWRLSVLATALPALFAPVFRRYHDETKPWKLAVRDVSKKKKPLFENPSRYRRRLILAALLATSAGVVTCGLDAVLRHRLRDSIRYENALQGRSRDDRLEDGALIAFLLRYPQLLDTREISSLDLTLSPGKLATTTDDLSRCLLEGMIRPPAKTPPKNRETLIDNSLLYWTLRNGNGRTVESLSLDEINRFWHAAELELAEGETRLDEKNVVPDEGRGTLSGANLWEARKSVLKTLLLELQIRHENRRKAEDRELAVFFLRFLLGSMVGLGVRIMCEKRFGTRKTTLVFGVTSLVVCSGLPLFTPSPSVTEYASLGLYVPALGFCTVPFLAGLCVLTPRLFRSPVRAMGCGFALAAGSAVSLLLFSIPSAGWTAAAIPLVMLPGVLTICFSNPKR